MSDPQNLVGQQIGRYRIDQHLARGGMADVFLAHDVDLDRPVALKVMLATLAEDADFVERFRREARAVARLEHPNIVQIYDTGLTEAQQPYIAMQYIEGGSLRDALDQQDAQNRLYPTVQALWLTKQIAAALDAAHNAGIVHRDIKPNNILLRRDGTPVLTDLGIAAVQGTSRLTQTGKLIGTPHYMSPEQVRGQSVDGRSDIYSLGIILYELLAGGVPFRAEDSLAVMHQQAYEPPPSLSNMRAGLSSKTIEVVTTCLEKEPDDRYQTAAQLVAALDQAVAAEAAGGWATPAAAVAPGAAADATVIDRAPAVAERKSNRRWAWALLLLIPLALLLVFFLSQQFGNASVDPVVAANATLAAVEQTVTSEAVLANDGEDNNGDGTGAAVADPGSGDDTPAGNEGDDAAAVAAVQPTSTIAPTVTATATATPPTETPLPTDTPVPTDPPPPTATIPPTAPPCNTAVHGPFSNAYQEQLGCATGGATTGLWMASENFEGGRMFWRSDNDRIYAVYNNGAWASYQDIWNEGDPAFSCGTDSTPPTPQRGFGKIWCTYDNVRSGLGNATGAESGSNGTLQSFTNGFILQTADGRIYTFNNNGTWR